MADEDSAGLVGRPLVIREIRDKPSDNGYHWAGENLDWEEACKHFIVVGSSGTGKTVLLKMLMQSVIGKMGVKGADGKLESRRRAVVYDPKTDLINFLWGVHKHGAVDFRILNPLDKRFSPWNVAADILTENDAIEFASILIPRSEHDNAPYFGDTARSLVTGVVKRFQATAKRTQEEVIPWTLRDVLIACESTRNLETTLDHDEVRYLEEHFSKGNAKNYGGVKSTLDTALSIYRPIAAVSHAARGRAIGITEWLSSDSMVLILGNNETAREATDTLNRLLFRQLSKCIIDRPGNASGDETWVCLDEIREAGALSGLRQLLLRGRSKGVAVAIGFQDVEGVYAAYGDHDGAEIIGAAQNVAILHLNPTSPDTSEWASRVFSSRRQPVVSKGKTTSETPSRNTSEHFDLVPRVFPIEFTEMPMPSANDGLHFYAATNRNGKAGRGGAGKGVYPWPFLKEHGSFDIGHRSCADFEPQTDRTVFRLKPWQATDLDRLGLPLSLLDRPKPVSDKNPLLDSMGDGH